MLDNSKVFSNLLNHMNEYTSANKDIPNYLHREEENK